jgi:hypothetical protein
VIGGIFNFVAESRGGKGVDSRQVENFVAHLMAANTRAAAELTNIRREYGSDPPPRKFRHAAAGTREAAAEKRKEVMSNEG